MQTFCKIWCFSVLDYNFHLQKNPWKAAKEDSKRTTCTQSDQPQQLWLIPKYFKNFKA